MDQLYEFQGLSFVWNSAKARANQRKHGVTFERATRVFFDPLFRLVDASRNCEARDAAIGYDEQSRLLYVVHVEQLNDFIGVISARKAAPEERRHYDS